MMPQCSYTSEKMESVNHKYFDDTESESKAETKSLRTSSNFSKIRQSEMHRSKSIGFFAVAGDGASLLGILDPPRVSSTHFFDAGCERVESESSKSISRLPRSLSSPLLQKSRHTYNRAIGKDLSTYSSGTRVVSTEKELRLLDSLLSNL